MNKNLEVIKSNQFEKEGKAFVRITELNGKKSEIRIGFNGSRWFATVQFFVNGNARGMGFFNAKYLKTLMNTLKKECGYCGF